MTVSLSRRKFLEASSGSVACAWLSLALPAIASVAKAADQAQLKALPFQFFDPDQACIVVEVTGKIFPSDKTPGAREAGAVYFIDQVLLNQQAQVAELLVSGLNALQHQVRQSANADSFADLKDKEQLELIRGVEDTPFFGVLHFLTICAIFSNPSYGGNNNKVGWQLINFDDRAIWQPPFGYYDAFSTLALPK
jgi:gluconate 2-dehydrogenase gamma chain